MKIRSLALVISLLSIAILVVVANLVTLTAVVGKDSAIYKVDDDGPLSSRQVLEVVPLGGEVRILECIDTKSDLFLLVQASSGTIGHMYQLDLAASASLSARNLSVQADQRLRPAQLIGCLFWL